MANIIFLPFKGAVVDGTANDDVFVCDSGSFIPQGGGGAYDAGHLKAGYKIVGGDGYDTIDLNADTSIIFGTKTLSGIEQLMLDPDARIGAGPGHAYHLIVNDGNVSPGQMLFIDGVYSTSFFFDGSAETNGSFDVIGGRGHNTMIGGAGDDTFLVQHGGGSVKGGGGDDLVLAGGVRGDGQPNPVFHDGDLQGGDGTDTLWLGRTFLHMTHFDAASSGFEHMEGSPDIAAGNADNTLDFSGFTVSTPNNRLIAHGGAGDDVLTGWSADNFLFGDGGNDQLTGSNARNTFDGGAGADTLIAGTGDDIFVYRHATDSSGAQIDTIRNFDFAHDRFDVAGTVTIIAYNGGDLRSNEAALFTPHPAHPNVMEIVIDQNHQIGYQAGQDLLIQLVDPLHADQFGTADFI